MTASADVTTPDASAATPDASASASPAAAGSPNPPAWPIGLDALGYGGDYNPEQWDDATRTEDIELMKEAGVTIVSLAIFSWAQIEPREGEYDWEWLDVTMDRLHEAGIRVDLATATASPPPWLSRKYPEILPELADGTVLHPGGRQQYRISSPIFRRYAVAMTRRIAERYADHPGLAMWHIDNEIGCHAPHDFSADAEVAFQRWLAERYGTIEALNHAWGTAFWSQRYDSFEEILPPRTAPTFPNPTQQLDFARYSSDELFSYYRDLRAVLAEVTPHIPCTTNFMVMAGTKAMDYARWMDLAAADQASGGAGIDIVSNDHYVIAADPHAERELAFSADHVRSLAKGAPWMLMEHSTSAVNWQPHNRTRTTAESHRNTLSHLAHGADALMFFQWRQSRAGAEKYHSAMYPHAGRESDVWRGTVRLGQILERIGEVRGSRVEARAAIIYDYESTWAARLDSHPTSDIDPRLLAQRFHTALARRGITSDIVRASDDLSGYEVIVVPEVYLVTDDGAANLAAAAARGATVLVSYFSGIVDEHDHVRLGGYPGAFRELLGVRTEEFWALQPGEHVTLDDGSQATLWSEKVHVTDPEVEVLRTFAGGPLDQIPALTRRRVGSGSAWYLATNPSQDGLQKVIDAVVRDSGITPVLPDLPAGVEVTRRRAQNGRSWLFVLNHSDTDVTLPVSGQELIEATTAHGELLVQAGAVAVIREG